MFVDLNGSKTLHFGNNNFSHGMMAAIKTWWDEGLGGVSAYAADTGSANAHAIAPAPAITAYAAGQAFHFFAANANTGAATLNVNGLGGKAVQLNAAALVSGAIGADDLVRVVYDGTQFQLPSLPSSLVLSDLTVDTDTLHIDSANNRVVVGSLNSTARTNADDLIVGNAVGNVGVTIRSETTGFGELVFSDSLTTSYSGIFRYDHSVNGFDWFTNAVETMTLDSSGNLDLPSGNLEIGGAAVLPVDQLTTLGSNSFDQTVDSLLLWDNSASAHKQVKLQDLGLTVVSAAAAQTFALADANTLQSSTSATGVAWTVPPNSSVAFETGTVIQLYQSGAGQVTLAPGAGVTLRSPNGTKTSQQYGVACIAKVGADEWVAYGDLTT